METKKIKKVAVRNLRSPKSGRPIPNQFLIGTDEGDYFQSYKTVIVFIDDTGQVYLDPQWQFSRTTSKYRNIFLRETTKETQKKIDSGEYSIKNLN